MEWSWEEWAAAGGYDGEWKVVGSYPPQKEDDQRMWVSGKLGPTGSYFQGGKLGYHGSRNPMGHTGRWEIQKKAHQSKSIVKVKGCFGNMMPIT